MPEKIPHEKTLPLTAAEYGELAIEVARGMKLQAKSFCLPVEFFSNWPGKGPQSGWPSHGGPGPKSSNGGSAKDAHAESYDNPVEDVIKALDKLIAFFQDGYIEGKQHAAYDKAKP